MPFSGAAALYPDGAYTHDSLELDGVILQETPMLAGVGQHTDEGSGCRPCVGGGYTCLQLRPIGHDRIYHPHR